jgi:very-short-patch-repair endonuclease
MVFGVIGSLPRLATVSFISAYCCLILVLYGWVNSVKVNSLKRWELQQKLSKPSNRIIAEEPPLSEISEPQESMKWQLEKRKEKLQQLLKDKVKPIGASQARQGVSEREFGQYLQLYFDEVIQGAEFQVSWQNQRQLKVRRKSKLRTNYNYSADFLVIHSLTGLGLDVEVDEPYTLLTKEPTHCIDRPQDCWRNQFFLESGWVVVRFSEQQVVEAPRSCCKVIAQVIFEITGDRRYLQQLEGEPELLPERPWTVREAKRRARSNYRLQYLPQSVRESMQSSGRRRRLRK